MRYRRKRSGCSHAKRVADINRIYDVYSKTGLSNREIWKRYIYPVYGLCERQFYNLLKAPMEQSHREMATMGFLFPEMYDEHEEKHAEYFRKIDENEKRSISDAL